MGKRNSQRKSAAMFDTDDDSSVTSSTTSRSDMMSVYGGEDVQCYQDSVLDQALDALDEKRGSTRENALSSIIEAFNSNIQHEFVEKKFATLLHQCLASLKKGSKKASAKEISLASHAVGCLALTVGSGNNAREIFEESVRPLDESLASKSDVSKIPSLLECLAIVVAVKPSAQIITSVVSSWSFLLSTIDDLNLNSKAWQNQISYLSGLLEKEDRAVRIAAGEALALIFEIGTTEKFANSRSASDTSQEESKPQGSYIFLQGLKGKVINQCKNLSVEAGGKGSAKKDLTNQRNLFRDILEFFEYGYCPETTTKIGGDSLQTSSWSQMIQLNFLKHFLGAGFIKHMQENEFLHDVFDFTPKKKLNNNEQRMSVGEKRLFKSPNSVLNKARTQYLNKQRLQAEGRNFGHYAASAPEEEA
ncbi:hypothetical protein PIB30_017328 [Stylosanthes scabra]|uniref:Interferon-related developmental regulator 1 n=1 Tax=Stylosanthes scabra TaxID=79078 RepID=A0ABU6S7R2_9FABA|nr:hypothetical protein [Stylosanthes scabra]